MTPHSFLSRVLPHLKDGESYFSLALGDGGKPRTFAFNNLSGLVNASMNMAGSGFDCYFALGSFFNARNGRKANNASAFRCLWADIDAGKKGSAYRSWQEALAALVQFAKETDIHPTIIVRSGMGLHVYWTFEQAMPAEHWLGFALAFQSLCRAKGLDVDPARAHDAASVLRVPGTIHTKSGNPVEVIFESARNFTPEALRSAFAANGGPTPEQALIALLNSSQAPSRPNPAAAAQQQAMDDLGLGFDVSKKGELPPADRIVDECPQIISMGLGTEPHWYAAMGVLKRCSNGREWTHKLSALDPERYDRMATDAKFDHAPQDSPTTCARFQSINPVPCEKCQHRGRFKSPIQIAKLPAVAPPPPPPPAPEAVPDEVRAVVSAEPVKHLDPSSVQGFKRLALNCAEFVVDERGIVMRSQVKDQFGNLTIVENIISEAKLYYLYSVWDNSQQHRPERTHMFEVVQKNGKSEKVLFSIRQDMTQQAIMTWFYNAKVLPTNIAYGGKIFMALMNAYLTAVSSQEELPARKEFGWTTMRDPSTGQEIPAFLSGLGAVTENGLVPVHYADAAGDISDQELGYSGNLQEWTRIAGIYKELEQHVGQFAVCLSFAAPLMKYALGDASNAIFSLWSSDGGKGKTHVLKVAASVWGDPSAQFISRSASTVARGRKLSILRNLPAFMDEMTDVPEEDMYGLAYTLTEGREKNKLKSSGAEFVKTGNWNTVTFITANRSFKAAISNRAGDSNATLLRVMEYECDFRSYEKQPQTQQYINETFESLKRNYGLAGPEFLFRLLQKPERVATLPTMIAHWAEKNKMKTNERYMYTAMALAIQAGRWAKEWGLIDYDMDELEKWVMGRLTTHNREMTEEEHIDTNNLLGDFLADMIPNTLVVAGASRMVGELDPGCIDEKEDRFLLLFPKRGSIHVRFNLRENQIVILPSALKKWCRNRKVSHNVFIAGLRNNGVRIEERYRGLTSCFSCLPNVNTQVYLVDTLTLSGIGIDPKDIVQKYTEEMNSPERMAQVNEASRREAEEKERLTRKYSVAKRGATPEELFGVFDPDAYDDYGRVFGGRK